MEEDATHAEPSSTSGSTHTIPQQQPENTEFFTPSFSPSSAPSSPTPVGTLSRLGLKSPTSPAAAAAPGGQLSAITVVALLDQLVNMLESVKDNQQRMEQRQADLESAVRVVQGDVTRLSKTHLSTANSVNKLLERSRKVSGNLKEVKERLDKQGVQVKKLEANHNHLLKRNNFKVLIFQEDNEIPSSLVVKDSFKTPQPSQYDAESTRPTPSITGSVEGIRTQDEGLQTVSLSSDDDDADFAAAAAAHQEDEDMMQCEATGGAPIRYERRADRFKRNSLKKVDSLKKAFSRQSIEKRVSQITTKFVTPEKHEKIKKSFTPNHPKSPTAKTSSFKVPPMTFNVKKVRDGETPTQEAVSPGKEAQVEIPPLGGLDDKIPLAEVHTVDEVVEEVMENVQETLSPSSPDSANAELSLNQKSPGIECEMNGESCAGLAVPEQDEDEEDDDDEEGEKEKEKEEKHKSPVETAADAPIPTAKNAVEPVS